MSVWRGSINESAMARVAGTFGALSGLGGLRHAAGEMLQGNTATDGIMIESWADGPLATRMDGEPGLTILPNFLLTGLVVSVISLAVIVWSLRHLDSRRAGSILILLSIGMLLFGGGVGPPVIGLLAGVVALGIDKPHLWLRTRLSGRAQHLLARSWPWVFGLSVFNALFLFVGSLILVYTTSFANADLVLMSFYVSVFGLLVSGLTAAAHDLQRRDA